MADRLLAGAVLVHLEAGLQRRADSPIHHLLLSTFATPEATGTHGEAAPPVTASSRSSLSSSMSSFS
jgi:hypothetical protein